MTSSNSVLLIIILPLICILMAYVGTQNGSSSDTPQDKTSIRTVTQYPSKSENRYSQDIERILFSTQDIEDRVQKLAHQISTDYHGKQLVLVGLMRGAYHLLSDISRHLSIPHEVDIIGVTTYSGQHSTNNINLYHELAANVEKKHIVVIEDLCDTAFTLNWLITDYFVKNKTGYESLSVCCLLDKVEAKRVDGFAQNVQPYLKYVGFPVDNVFVVGYGMDYRQHYRSLPFIGVLKKEIYKADWNQVVKDLHQ